MNLELSYKLRYSVMFFRLLTLRLCSVRMCARSILDTGSRFSITEKSETRFTAGILFACCVLS